MVWAVREVYTKVQGQTEILTGLNGTERVVLEGIDRLSEGHEVQIVKENIKATSTRSATG